MLAVHGHWRSAQKSGIFDGCRTATAGRGNTGIDAPNILEGGRQDEDATPRRVREEARPGAEPQKPTLFALKDSEKMAARRPFTD